MSILLNDILQFNNLDIVKLRFNLLDKKKPIRFKGGRYNSKIKKNEKLSKSNIDC